MQETFGHVADTADVDDAAGAARRVGLFGGTFDPPHVGHLVTAVNVRHALQLDLVLLVVANVPWQKEGTRVITPAPDRLAMVAAAVEQVEGLRAGDQEIRLGGNSYTADTLQLVAEEFDQPELFTVVGDDAAAGLPTWERAGEVVERSDLVVVDRPGEPVVLPDRVDGTAVEWIRVEVPRLDVSSTDLRARIADGRPLDYLVTAPVLAEIERRGLYGRAASGAHHAAGTGAPGADAGVVDAGGVDAGGVDAGGVDAGGVDDVDPSPGGAAVEAGR
ncbi:MAG: nicotinate-nucleotide adenylyltransferase [Actinomycetota bacterium]